MIQIDWDPSRRALRQFAAVAFVFLAGAATVAHLRGRSAGTVAALLAAAVAVGVCAWLRPRTLRLLYVLLSLAAFPIGLVVSQLILLVVFYGVMTPLGFLARLVRPDPLRLRMDRQAPSYWQSRSRPGDPQTYLRQA
jgi:hypothetical protein